MGRKVHPYGFRLGVIRDWKARWYAEGDKYADLLHEDLAIRRFIQDKLGHAGISRVEIGRFSNQIALAIWRLPIQRTCTYWHALGSWGG